jgi:hypothetical protein
LGLTYFLLQDEGGDGAVSWTEVAVPVTNFPGRIDVALSVADGERSFEFAKTILLRVK